MRKIAIVIQPKEGNPLKVEGFRSDDEFLDFCLTLFQAAKEQEWTVEELIQCVVDSYETAKETESDMD